MLINAPYRPQKLYHRLLKNVTVYNLYYYFLVIAAISTSSCARVGAPTGGEKDSIPPTLTSMYPPLETTNFNSEEITLTFDELIQARDIKKELIITPPIEDYESRVNKRSIRIIINEPLLDSTTYTFNFRESIKDITEGNSADQVVAAFSTGDKIDSCKVKGKATMLMTGEPVNDAVVALYAAADTLDIFNSRPMYLTKTTEEGEYEIKYIKEGNYRLYAYIDSNGNLKDESDKEPYGFKSEILKLGKQAPSSDSIINEITADLEIFGVDARPLEILGSRPNGKYYEIRFNKYVTDYQLTYDTSAYQGKNMSDSIDTDIQLYKPAVIYHNFQEDHRNTRFYNTFKIDSIQTLITVTDSLNQQATDTFYIKFEETRRKPESLNHTVQLGNTNDNFNVQAAIEFNKPIAGLNTDSLLLKYDTLLNIPLVPEKDYIWNDRKDQLRLAKIINKDSLKKNVEHRLRQIDSVKEESLKAYQNTLLDSIQNLENTEERERVIETFLISQNYPKVSEIMDTLRNEPDQNQRTNILNAIADTLTVGIKIALKNKEITLNKGFQLYAGKGAFISVELDSSGRIKQEFPYLDPKSLGVIKGSVETNYKSFTIQLIDEKNSVIAETNNRQSYVFNNVSPGTYRIRVLIDANENGKWDYGNILKYEEPEPVYYYEAQVELRANWEVDDQNFSF